jgi:hypothetical protein
LIGFEQIVKKRKIKIKDLAEQIGVKEGRIWNWYRNRIPEKLLKRVSEV